MVEEWIPIVMFIGLTVVFSLYFWFRYRSRFDTQQTVRLALDKGHELTPELIDRIGHPKPPKNKDLRLAILWITFAVGLVLIGIAVPDSDSDVLRAFMAGAALPFVIGVAYLLMWRFAGRD